MMQVMLHNAFSWVMLTIAIILWLLAGWTHSTDVGMVCKMIANQAMVLCTLTVFGNFYISRGPKYEVWTRVYSEPLALAVLLGSVVIASAICAVGTLVIFGGE